VVVKINTTILKTGGKYEYIPTMPVVEILKLRNNGTVV